MNYKTAMFRDTERAENKISSALFVDPGLGGTGWAYFPTFVTKTDKMNVIPPISTGVIKIPPREYEGSWTMHAALVAAAFQGVLTSHTPHVVVLEQPELWSGSAMSHAATTAGAKGEPGDLFKLTYLIGQFGLLTKQVLGSLPILVHPYEWKGQLSKELVIARITALSLGLAVGPKDHEADAIGMGIAAQGLL